LTSVKRDPVLHAAKERRPTHGKGDGNDAADLRGSAGDPQHGPVPQKGRALFHEGDPANRFYGVIDGWVEVYRDVENGERAVLGVFTRGETFAEAAMFLSGTYPASAAAVTACRLCLFDEPAFDRLMSENLQLCRGMLGSLAQHLQRTTNEVERLQTRNTRQRLASFLVEMCDGQSGRAEVRLPFDKALIAALLGMKPESLSRCFAGLRPMGVRVAGDVVTVADPGRLAHYCRNGALRSRRRKP
jgi:CRP-like cAMP-binding protein